MSTNRTRIRRTSKRRITPEIIALWERLRVLPEDRRNITEPGVRELCTMLGLWWGYSANPVNVTGPVPPNYILANPLQADAWRDAWRCRCELEAAVGPRSGRPAKRERSEAERTRMMSFWRQQYLRVQGPDFWYALRPGVFLEGYRARRALLRWADIPPDLIRQWSSERKRRTKVIRGLAKAAT